MRAQLEGSRESRGTWGQGERQSVEGLHNRDAGPVRRWRAMVCSGTGRSARAGQHGSRLEVYVPAQPGQGRCEQAQSS